MGNEWATGWLLKIDDGVRENRVQASRVPDVPRCGGEVLQFWIACEIGHCTRWIRGDETEKGLTSTFFKMGVGHRRWITSYVCKNNWLVDCEEHSGEMIPHTHRHQV